VPSRNAKIFAVAITICALVFFLLVSAVLSPGSTGRTATYSTTSNNDSAGAAFLSGSAVYSQLGYPKEIYGYDTQYSPSIPNFTLEYLLMSFDVGPAPVMNLTQAVRVAEGYAGLSRANYSLVTAEFDPGVIANHAISYPATWDLWFAQVYHGYWLYGEGTVEASSEWVSLDATSGSILKSESFQTMEPAPGNNTLGVSASQALGVVRGLGVLQGVPPALTQGGNVTSISPRIVEFGHSFNYGYFQNPLDASLSGQDRLCWVISLSDHSGGGGWEGVFAVDTQSGKLLSTWTQQLYPGGGGFGGVGSSLILSSANNITISQETFQMSVNATGLPHTVAVAVLRV